MPDALTARILDFKRERQKTATDQPAETALAQPSAPPSSASFAPAPPSSASFAPAPTRGPLDFPSVANWLAACEDDLERGRDKHPYKSLIPMFSHNECTRIDDIARMSPELIRSLSREFGLEASIGLANRVYQYAVDDVAKVKALGKLSM